MCSPVSSVLSSLSTILYPLQQIESLKVLLCTLSFNELKTKRMQICLSYGQPLTVRALKHLLSLLTLHNQLMAAASFVKQQMK